jgi:PAS domain S-box-containing protein
MAETGGRGARLRSTGLDDGFRRVTDNEERTRADALLRGENRLLEMIARGDALAPILDQLCRLVEEISPGAVATILLLDAANRLWHAAAPSLAEQYTAALDGTMIGPAVGSCGTVAYRNEPVIVSDIAADPLWTGYRHLPLAHGLQACWSMPIRSSTGSVVGTFAIYSRERWTPGPERRTLIEQIARLASIAIERTRIETALRCSEAYLREAQRLSRTGSFGWCPASGEIVWSEETFRIFECDPATKPSLALVLSRTHPEDRVLVQQTMDRALRSDRDFELAHRLELPDGSIKHVHIVARAIKSEWSEREFVGAVSDVTAAQDAEDRIRQNEREFRDIVDSIPALILVLSPEGKPLYGNQTLLEYAGLMFDDVPANDFRERIFHPEDLERVQDERREAFVRGTPFVMEERVRRRDGQYRWFLMRFNPLRDEQGKIIRWYATGTDIDDRKQAEERVHRENIALRDEVDKTSMFEEIVGASPALQAVLSRVTKVAPTESTVLITGETGTGKELIARAIHKRSVRSSRAFVSVNCAGIPPSLVASELFGHEKGAFTGAVQRHLGRFELADGGTLFLDEVGDLPAETQVALLRVLQERQFERVGGNKLIRVDVRLIAATNRDLQAAAAAGDFRSDLFYRLSVFPIHAPPLRERKDDIRMLVEYFIARYAGKVGKKISGIEKKTLDRLQSYPWPGNIRELQNVIERSVILCETGAFAIDENWLSTQAPSAQPASRALNDQLASDQKVLIEAALAEANGRVSGPSGAAARLGIPPSTLDSRIRALKIDKQAFKRA